MSRRRWGEFLGGAAANVIITIMGAQRLAVLSAKGGVGKTTVSLALALGGVAQGKDVLCLDLDSNLGLTQVLSPGCDGKNFWEILAEGKVSAANIHEIQLDKSEGKLLFIPGGISSGEGIRVDKIERLLRSIDDLDICDVVVIDTPPDREFFEAVMQASDRLVVASDLDLLGLSCASLTVHEAFRLGLEHRLLGLVICNARRPLTKGSKVLLDGLESNQLVYPTILWRNASWEGNRSGALEVPKGSLGEAICELFSGVTGGWTGDLTGLEAFGKIAVNRRLTK